MIQPSGRVFAWVGLAGLLALAAIAYHGLAFWDPRSHGHTAVVGWFFETSDSSPQVIFGIVATLLFRRRSELREKLGGASAPGPGMLLLAAAAGLHVWALWVDAPDQMVVSLALVLLATGLLLGGGPLARVLAAPLALLAFAIPIPGALHNFVVYPYQLATSAFAELALRAAGFDVTLQGDVLTLEGRDFEVIETCSGLRSAQTLALLACAWATFFRCSMWHTVGLLAASPFIAFVTNGIRVLVLILDTRPEIQESHVAQGVAMFVVGTVALGLVDRALLRLGASQAAGLSAATPRATSEERWRLLPVAAALLVMAVATLGLPALRPAAPALEPPPELPRELAGWLVSKGDEPGHFLGNVHFTHRSNLVYERGRESISAFLGFDDRQLRMRSLLSEKNAVPGSGWGVEERSPVVLEPGGLRMESVVSRRFAVRALALHAYRGSGGVVEETLRGALALDRPGSPFARGGRASLLRLSIVVPSGPDGVREAEARLRNFYAELAPSLDW